MLTEFILECRLATSLVFGLSLSFFQFLPLVSSRWGGVVLALMSGGGMNNSGLLEVSLPIFSPSSRVFSRCLLVSTPTLLSHQRPLMKMVTLLSSTCSSGQLFSSLQQPSWSSTWSVLLLVPPMLSTAVTNHGGHSLASSSSPSGWLFTCTHSWRVSWAGKTAPQPSWLSGRFFLLRSSPCCGFASIRSLPVSLAQILKHVASTARNVEGCRNREIPGIVFSRIWKYHCHQLSVKL